MNSALVFCLRVLRGNVYNTDENVVPVIKRAYPLDKTPCITLDDTGGTSLISKDLINLKMELPTDHPQYEQGKLFPQEVIRSKYTASVNIHVWCDNENQRESIDNQVKHLFNMAYSDNYRFCKNYDKSDDSCSTLQSKCIAMTHFLGKSAKQQCPQPQEYGYESLFTQLDIDKYTMALDEPFSMDDLTMKPRVLRSIHRLRLNYYRNYRIGGNTLTNITIKE